MNFIGSKSERYCTVQLRPLILIITMLIPIFGLFLVPQAWGSEPKRDIVMMVDNSGSMKKNDPKFLARLALKEFMSENDENARLALITFDQNVNLAIPFTPLTDASRPLLFDAIQEIDYSGSLTNSPAALERAIYEIALHGRDDADKSIIFITDGIVDTGNKARDKQQEDWMLQELAVLASKLNIRIFVIAFAEAANYQLIQKLVSKTKGDYFRVLLADDLPRVFARLEEKYRPAVTPLSQENKQPKIALNTQQPRELGRETQDFDKNIFLPAPIEKDVLTEAIDSKELLDELERLAQSRPDSVQKTLLNKVQHLYTNYQVIIFSALFICLMAFGAWLILRKSTPRQLRSHPEIDPSFGDDQLSALLIDINNNTSHRNHPLSSRITKIGRADTGMHNNDIDHLLIDKPTIGREHALIEYKNDGYWLVDQDSANGTFVNGKRVRGRVRLKDGSRISFHDVEFIFSVPNLNKFDKTICVPIVHSQEEAEHDESALFTKKVDNRHFLETPSIATKKIDRSQFNSNAYKRSQDKARLKAVKEDEEYTKPFSNTLLRKRRVSNASKSMAPRSITNRIDQKDISKTTPDVNSDSKTEEDTEKLVITKLQTITSSDDRAQQSRKSDTTKTQTNSYSQIKGNTTEPIESMKKDAPGHHVTELPSNTEKSERVQELKRSDTEEIQVMPCSQIKKKTTDLMEESIREDTVDPDFSQLPTIRNTDEQSHESKKSDTKEISQDTFGLIFEPQQNENNSKQHTESVGKSQRIKQEVKETS